MRLTAEPFNWSDATELHREAERMRQEIHKMTNNLSNPAYSDKWEQIQDDLRVYIGLYRNLDYDLDEEVIATAEHALANPKDPHGPEVVENYWRSWGHYIECTRSGDFDSSLDKESERISGIIADDAQPEFKKDSLRYALDALEGRRFAITDSTPGWRAKAKELLRVLTRRQPHRGSARVP